MRAIDEFSEDRLHHVEQQVRRAQFDSKIRSWRNDGVGAVDHLPREREEPIEGLVSLMEVLSARIAGLDQKTRNLAEELRKRDRSDRRKFAATMVLLSIVLLIVVGRALADGRLASGPATSASSPVGRLPR